MSAARWVSPSPLWDALLPLGGGRFRAPTLLRFASDGFMDEFQAALASDPPSLAARVARAETWRRPAAGLAAATASSGDADGPGLKLYQPVHGRFYLVTASLACRVPGLPEHTVQFAEGETVSFVIRRVRDGADEAWVTGPDGTQGWLPAPAAGLAAGEELLPMFATSFDGENDMQRRVFAGLVPAGRRESYVGGRMVRGVSAQSQEDSVADDPLESPRVLEFQRAALEPWVELRQWYRRETAVPDRRAAANDAAVHASALILLDLARFLEAELPAVWAAVMQPAQAGSLSLAQAALHAALDFDVCTPTGAAYPLLSALRDAWTHGELIEGLELQVGANEEAAGAVPVLPPVLQPVVLVGRPFVAVGPLPANVDTTETRVAQLLARTGAVEEAPGLSVRRLKQLAMEALAEAPAASGAAAGLPGAAPAGRTPLLAPSNAQGDDRYIIRCVYRRPKCGPRHPPLLSERTEPFQLAGFFDPDAPQRPVRVALPVDTSAAGLRKFDKNVGFVLSNELRKQVSRVKGMSELMDGDVDNPRGLDISVICSLSIPIITICALILLMIIIALLNFVFWWIPFFRICFPVPSLKAKG